ncbi:hypothetical protein O1611_g953 [Lasiodiplodia mahajangana]|uniref:Uncharacterized protein n=1 Tax=Lasiodiplodia mahajangana TaxID=1108764 RepID=A0ACC2JYX1_9PEZI|nr:hypothetical protein O1611_g953 [Lasiodiplodia mahajangana]
MPPLPRLIRSPSDEDRLALELPDQDHSEFPSTATGRPRMRRLSAAMPFYYLQGPIQLDPEDWEMGWKWVNRTYDGGHFQNEGLEGPGSQRSSPGESIAGSDLSPPSRTYGGLQTPEISDDPGIDDDIEDGYDTGVSDNNTGNSLVRLQPRSSGISNRRISRRRYSNIGNRPQRLRHQGIAYRDIRVRPTSNTRFSTEGISRRPRSLDGRDMEVISGLFSHPSLHPAPREVNWHEFERTMANLGFSVTPGRGNARLSVSAPSERFPASSLGEVVTAHPPHAGRVALSLPEVRAIGSRLANAYGWSAETFLR